MKNKVFLSLSILPVLLGGLAGCNKPGEKPRVDICDMLLAKNSYSVVIPNVPTSSEEYAAEQIVYYYQKATGYTLPIIKEAEAFLATDSSYISIGNTSVFTGAVRNHGAVDLSKEALNIDGFNIFTYGNNVIINAYNERGKIYGAYEFIEDTLGVKFLNARYTHIPTLTKVELKSYDKTYVPMFSQRAYLNTSVFTQNKSYTSHMRYNTDYCQLDESMGGSTKWCSFNGNTSHTMLEILPASKYATGEYDSFGNIIIKKDYREVFSHTGSGDDAVVTFFTQSCPDYCFTNGIKDDGTYDAEKEISTAKLTIETLKEWILKNPDCENFMIGQGDTPAGCTCDRCAAATRKYKGGGKQVRFINVVTEQIKKWMAEEGIDRNIYITMFAYSYTATPPVDENHNPIDKTVYPREDVYVKYCPIQSAYYYSIDDERQNASDTFSLFEDWSKLTNRFHAWTYHAWFSNGFFYYPSAHAMKQTMKALKKGGVVYEFAQGGFTEENFYSDDLNSYVFSKLCWDIDRDVNDITNEFLHYYFGEAAYKYAREFHDEVEDRYHYISTQTNDMRTSNHLLQAEYWPNNSTKKLVDSFDKALAATIADTTISEAQKDAYISNIERASLTAKWMRLQMLDRYPGISETDVANAAAEWVALAEKYGVKKTGEAAELTLAAVKSNYGIK